MEIMIWFAFVAVVLVIAFYYGQIKNNPQPKKTYGNGSSSPYSTSMEDIKEIPMALTPADMKSQIQFTFAQMIREFEQATGMRVVGMKIKRDESIAENVESVVIKAEMRDDE